MEIYFIFTHTHTCKGDNKEEKLHIENIDGKNEENETSDHLIDSRVYTG